MTPQQLMDLPYAGMAETYFRRVGEWKLTDEEKLNEAVDRLLIAFYGLSTAMDKMSTAMDEMEELTK